VRRRLAAALALCLALSPATLAGAAEPRASLPDIEDEVMCTICGTTLEQSGSPQAERERELIRRLIAEGRDKEEIKDVLVAEYGPEVLAVPDDEGFDLAAWLVPVFGLLLAGLGIGILLRRRSREAEPSDERAAIAAADDARLREDMSGYDL
jgi:cytochrome c-type biogenesis protein CcmH